MTEAPGSGGPVRPGQASTEPVGLCPFCHHVVRLSDAACWLCRTPFTAEHRPYQDARLPPPPPLAGQAAPPSPREAARFEGLFVLTSLVGPVFLIGMVVLSLIADGAFGAALLTLVASAPCLVGLGVISWGSWRVVRAGTGHRLDAVQAVVLGIAFTMLLLGLAALVIVALFVLLFLMCIAALAGMQ